MNTITVEELHEALAHPAEGEKALVMDVRSPEEFAAGHIPGAVNRPLEKLALYKESLAAYDHVYVNCFSGGRSGQACAELASLGLKDLRNVEGGMMLWKRAGYEVEV